MAVEVEEEVVDEAAARFVSDGEACWVRSRTLCEMDDKGFDRCNERAWDRDRCEEES